MTAVRQRLLFICVALFTSTAMVLLGTRVVPRPQRASPMHANDASGARGQSPGTRGIPAADSTATANSSASRAFPLPPVETLTQSGPPPARSWASANFANSP